MGDFGRKGAGQGQATFATHGWKLVGGGVGAGGRGEGWGHIPSLLRSSLKLGVVVGWG